jgi:hypothetical protein
MRKVAVIVAAAVLTGLVVGLVVADSDDGSAESPPPAPELTAPPDSGSESGRSGESDRTRTEPAPEQSPGQPGPPATGGAQPPPVEDTEQTDQPPPRGSPAERFERFCEQNPGACQP